MKHGLIGGGNIGALMAAELAAQGHEVVIYTSDPEKWSESIQIVDGDGNTVEESCAVEATSSLAHAVEGSAYIWITYPTSLFGEIAERLLPPAPHRKRLHSFWVSEGAQRCAHSRTRARRRHAG